MTVSDVPPPAEVPVPVAGIAALSPLVGAGRYAAGRAAARAAAAAGAR